jgi:hypothetical protein
MDGDTLRDLFPSVGELFSRVSQLGEPVKSSTMAQHFSAEHGHPTVSVQREEVFLTPEKEQEWTNFFRYVQRNSDENAEMRTGILRVVLDQAGKNVDALDETTLENDLKHALETIYFQRGWTRLEQRAARLARTIIVNKLASTTKFAVSTRLSPDTREILQKHNARVDEKMGLSELGAIDPLLYEVPAKREKVTQTETAAQIHTVPKKVEEIEPEIREEYRSMRRRPRKWW